jgi:SAM-dependent methyltransferase
MLRRLRLLDRYVVALTWLIIPAVAVQTPPETEFPEIADLLQLKSGSIVADVGAGSGSWTILLADNVGPTGHVFATDVRPEFVSGIRQATAKLPNVTVVLGTQDSTELPPQCCDAVLLRMVYHAFRNPKAMRGSLARALRPGGRVLVIDFPGDTGPVPLRPFSKRRWLTSDSRGLVSMIHGRVSKGCSPSCFGNRLKSSARA